jgi:hypothetical protein
MELIAVWFVFAAGVGILASQRHRSGVGWFLLAVLISPLIAGFLVLVMGPKHRPAIVGVADELTKLTALRDAGTISSVEYENQRARLLG